LQQFENKNSQLNLTPVNIKELREKAGFSQRELSEKTGIPKGRINGWEQTGSKPKAEDFIKLKAFFENLYFRENKEKPTSVKEPKLNYDKRLIPLYDVIAIGGTNLLADQAPIDAPAAMIDPGTALRRATGSLRVYGHSMFPKYPAGCIVAYKDADKDLIIWGEDYVIELSDRRIIKRIDKGEDLGIVRAVSYNKSEEYVYASIDIPVQKIKRLYMVLGKIELESSI
jgi:transcriptional regulator with XRE-family HTH domain